MIGMSHRPETWADRTSLGPRSISLLVLSCRHLSYKAHPRPTSPRLTAHSIVRTTLDPNRGLAVEVVPVGADDAEDLDAEEDVNVGTVVVLEGKAEPVRGGAPVVMAAVDAAGSGPELSQVLSKPAQVRSVLPVVVSRGVLMPHWPVLQEVNVIICAF